jgi:predicted nucleic acid-binding protein
VLVVDASVLAPVVADDGPDGTGFRDRLRGETLVGPDLLRLDVVSVLRRQLRTGELTDEQAAAAMQDALDLLLRVVPTAPLLPRVWELRENLSSYDACYVALAEALDAPLLTADRRLANAPGVRCRVEVLSA